MKKLKSIGQLVGILDQNIKDIRLGVEVGVWKGHTSAMLLKCFPHLWLRMVDPWDNEISKPTMIKTVEVMEEAESEARELTEFANERRLIIKKTSAEATKEVSNKVLDFVFIDACHLYKSVKRDIQLWFPKVRYGGVVSGHDYGGRGDRK